MNSTLSGNSATGQGGSAINLNKSALTIENSTVTGNDATEGGGIGVGSGNVTIGNTIIANNTASGVGSPAIDAGSCADGADQRGYFRPVDGNGDGTAICDIGAYEYGATP